MKDTCPICGGKEFIILGKAKTNSISANFINADYKVVKCNRCFTYYISPQIAFNDEQWSMLYNSEYFSIQSKWLIKQRAKELKQRFDKAEYFLNRKENIKFLDIGTGEGKTLIEGLRRGWEITGIDIVDNRIESAKTGKIIFTKAKFLESDFPEHYFDFIYLDSVLEHVLNPVEYLMKIKKILKHGGILYVGVPNEDCLFNDVRRIIFNIIGKKGISEKLKPFDSPYHVIGFNSASLKYLINKVDLELKLFNNFGRRFDFLSSPITNKAFWISLFFLFPIELVGYILKRDVYFETFLKN